MWEEKIDFSEIHLFLGKEDVLSAHDAYYQPK